MVKLFKRKIYSKLVEWKNRSNGETAILIEGARRIGKTSVAKEFGTNEFSDYLLIDFSVASSVVLSLFDDLFNIDIFFERLFLAFGIKPLDKGSLIIFDEIQFCPKARQAIKTLVNDGVKRDYIFCEYANINNLNIRDIVYIPMVKKRMEFGNWTRNIRYLRLFRSSLILIYIRQKPFRMGTAWKRRLQQKFG